MGNDKKCDCCGIKLGVGDKVAQTFTLNDYNFNMNDFESFVSADDDKKLLLCKDCCQNMNFREYENEPKNPSERKGN